MPALQPSSSKANMTKPCLQTARMLYTRISGGIPRAQAVPSCRHRGIPRLGTCNWLPMRVYVGVGVLLFHRRLTWRFDACCTSVSHIKCVFCVLAPLGRGFTDPVDGAGNCDYAEAILKSCVCNLPTAWPWMPLCWIAFATLLPWTHQPFFHIATMIYCNQFLRKAIPAICFMESLHLPLDYWSLHAITPAI